jgi:hypothetical protein
MGKVCLGLGQRLDRVMLGRRTEAQTVELREDVPNPVRLLAAAPDLGEGLIVIVCLRLYETAQVVRVVGHG